MTTSWWDRMENKVMNNVEDSGTVEAADEPEDGVFQWPDYWTTYLEIEQQTYIDKWLITNGS